MADLLLDSLEIENFRAFKHLKIEKLGRVNLIVGQNSVGKTALLEALWLYANRGSFQTVIKILRMHNELSRQWNSTTFIQDEEIIIEALKNLFFGRKEIRTEQPNLTIGTNNLSKNINLDITKVTVKGSGENQDNQLNALPTITSVLDKTKLFYLVHKNSSQFLQGMALETGAKFDFFPLEEQITTNLVGSWGISENEVTQMWGNVTLTSLENTVIDALRIINPNIERIAIINEFGNSFESSTLVKMKNISNRIALRSLGDGLSRIFGIVLALVNSKDGMLLVDEIENGLHFTAQLGLWRLIFSIARQLNVQIFATTHSWDCIQAFQQASSEDAELGMVIRLNNIDGEITATSFDERRLAIVTREQIEVR